MRRLLRGGTVGVALAIAFVFGMSPNANAASWTGFNFHEENGGVRHAQTWGSIGWQARDRFAIPNLWLKDTSCDSQPVFVQIEMNFVGTAKKRWNRNGCGSSVDFGNVHGQVNGGIRGILIRVCRDTVKPQCDTRNFYNPLY